MGTWGTSLSSNDTYADAYADFFDLYNQGESVESVSKKLIADNREIIEDPEECNNFWFALAKAQWECKQLDKEILDKIRQIVETGSDLDVWRRRGCDAKALGKRKTVLEVFLAELHIEKSKATPRKKKIIQPPPFRKGDCLTFTLENGNYGGAVVLEAMTTTEYGACLIAATRINQAMKPTKGDFEKAEVLIANYANWEDKPCVQWYSCVRHDQTLSLVEACDALKVEVNYDVTKPTGGFVADFDVWFIQVVNRQFLSEQTKPKPVARQTIKELTQSKRK